MFSSQVTKVDVETELQTYKHSRQGLDEMYNEARRQLRDESQLRQVGHIKITLAARQWEKKLCIHVCITGSPCCTVGKKNVLGEITTKK